jgi:hypothetical protein
MALIQLVLPLQELACARCPLNIADRCEGPITSGSIYMRGPDVIGCGDAERIQQYLDDLRDPKSLAKQPSRHSLISLSPFIPVLPSGVPKETELPELEYYGVSLSTILDRESGSLLYKSAQTIRRGLRLPTNSKLAMLGGCKDEKLNRVWSISRDKDIWKRIADLGFDFVTSLSYSVYDTDPRSDQIVNQMRNFLTYEYFCSLGIPCIPFVFFNPHSDLDFKCVIEWLEDRPDVTRIAMLGQSYVHETEFELVLREMRMLSGALKRPLDFLIVGAGAASKLHSISLEFPTATITNEWPAIAGLNGGRILPNLKEEPVPRDVVSKADLVRDNIQQFNCSYDEIRQSYLNHPGRLVA